MYAIEISGAARNGLCTPLRLAGQHGIGHVRANTLTCHRGISQVGFYQFVEISQCEPGQVLYYP